MNVPCDFNAKSSNKNIIYIGTYPPFGNNTNHVSRYLSVCYNTNITRTHEILHLRNPIAVRLYIIVWYFYCIRVDNNNDNTDFY